MKFDKKDLLGIKDLSVNEINLILETAESFLEVSTRKIKKSADASRQNDNQSVL